MSKTRELTNSISCLDLSPKYRKRPEKLVDVGVQVKTTKKEENTKAKTKAKIKTKTQTITKTKTRIAIRVFHKNNFFQKKNGGTHHASALE